MTAAALSRQRACDDPAGSWELVRRAQAGDRDAFADIWRRYHEFVLTFVLVRVGRDRAVAEDITSDVFLTAIRRIDSFTRPERDLGAWLATIARNKVIDYYKCGPRRFEVSHDLPPDPSSRYAKQTGWVDVWEGGGARHAPDAAEETLTRDRDRALWRAVRDLDSQPQRRVIALRFLRGLSIEETARVMGGTVGQVKALQYRATRALRRAARWYPWR